MILRLVTTQMTILASRIHVPVDIKFYAIEKISIINIHNHIAGQIIAFKKLTYYQSYFFATKGIFIISSSKSIILKLVDSRLYFSI